MPTAGSACIRRDRRRHRGRRRPPPRRAEALLSRSPRWQRCPTIRPRSCPWPHRPTRPTRRERGRHRPGRRPSLAAGNSPLDVGRRHQPPSKSTASALAAVRAERLQSACRITRPHGTPCGHAQLRCSLRFGNFRLSGPWSGRFVNRPATLGAVSGVDLAPTDTPPSSATVTSYLGSHPGGTRTVTPWCGKESTAAFTTEEGRGEHSPDAG